MELVLPGEDDPRRLEVRAWLRAHPEPTGRQLAERGLVAPHWPAPWGWSAGPVEQLVVDDELRRAGVARPFNPIGVGWAGPTLLQAGTDEQRERWLWPMLAGEEVWCQLFSEPEAGSDLASLATRARRVGGGWVVSGEKVWTSFAHRASFGILLARTDPTVPAHRGLSYFVCPMDAPGVEVRPLVDMTGAHAFNQVRLDDVVVPADHLVGDEGGGWSLARVTLANERVSLSGEGALWGNGPTAADLLAEMRARGGVSDPVLRRRLVDVWSEGEVLRWLRWRSLQAQLDGRPPGPEASVRKALADAHGQRLMVLGRDLAGPAGAIADGGTWAAGFLYSPALTIGGGTAEVQRNIVAERVLGLRREVEGHRSAAAPAAGTGRRGASATSE
ncbi:MAG: acyl-CoA dehydrogenase family protein [Acidimicrobiales bacterium]